jgi:hypothetical protein
MSVAVTRGAVRTGAVFSDRLVTPSVSETVMRTGWSVTTYVDSSALVAVYAPER